MNKDIVKAVEAENAYIIDSATNAQANIYNYLAPYGYLNLEEFKIDKINYLLTQINFSLFLNEDTKNIDTRVWQAIENQEPCIWVPAVPSELACVGTDAFDYSKANELGILILNMPHSGGTIITGPEDLTIGIHFPSTYADEYYNLFFNKMTQFLAPYNIVPVGNDFLYNGKKVVGCSEYRGLGNTASFFFSATFIDHAATIEALCQKQSTKIPGFIPQEILTREMLLKEVLSWLGQRI